MADFFVQGDGTFVLRTTTALEAKVLARARRVFGDEEIRDLIKSRVQAWEEQFQAKDATRRQRLHTAASLNVQQDVDTALGFVED